MSQILIKLHYAFRVEVGKLGSGPVSLMYGCHWQWGVGGWKVHLLGPLDYSFLANEPDLRPDTNYDPRYSQQDQLRQKHFKSTDSQLSILTLCSTVRALSRS